MIGREIKNLTFESRIEYLLQNCDNLLAESMDEPDFLILQGTDYFFSPVKWKFLKIVIEQTSLNRKTRKHYYFNVETLLEDVKVSDDVKTGLLFNLEIFR